MQSLAQILAGVPADPYDNQSQGIAPLLQQHMQPGMQPGMAPQMQPGLGGAPAGGLPPDMLQQLLARHQQQMQAPGIGSMGDPMGAGY